MVALVLDVGRDPVGERERHRDHELRHLGFVASAGVGDHHRVGETGGRQEAVGAGTADLDETKAFGSGPVHRFARCPHQELDLGEHGVEIVDERHLVVGERLGDRGEEVAR